MSLVRGIKSIGLDVEVPTRQVQALRPFGLDALATYDWRGRYITTVGDPTARPDVNGRQPIVLALFLLPGLPEARINRICFDVEDVDDAVRVIKSNGIEVDEEDADRIYGPEGLVFQIDSATKPRREFMPGAPKRPAYMPIEEYEKTVVGTAAPGQKRAPYTRTPPNNAGLITGIDHVALEVQSPTRLAAFLKQAFGLAPVKAFHRRGRYITTFGDPDAPKDPDGRRSSLLAVFFAPWLERAELNHVCFAVDDVEDAVRRIRAEGAWVDEEYADRIYGPEGLVWQVDSAVRPRPEFPARCPTAAGVHAL
jgi:catechol 2,3-dioxygenase-like lactoylglutathione lyase family enzyme